MINLDGHFKYSHATLAYMTHGGTQQRLRVQVVVLNWLSCIRDSFFLLFVLISRINLNIVPPLLKAWPLTRTSVYEEGGGGN